MLVESLHARRQIVLIIGVVRVEFEGPFELDLSLGVVLQVVQGDTVGIDNVAVRGVAVSQIAQSGQGIAPSTDLTEALSMKEN